MPRLTTDDLFAELPGAPRPLEARVAGRVRFDEVDPLGIVWHGRYVTYFEDGRAEWGRRFGLTYLDMRGDGFVAPVVRLEIDYRSPLEFDQEFRVVARLHWSEAVRLNYSYEVLDDRGQVAARGRTVQVLTDPDGRLLLAWPPVLESLRRRWRAEGLP